jgi:ATP-dependent RNA helicase MSS116
VRRQLQHVKVLVLDEADQLLDMGFRKSLDGIIKVLPQQRQTLLFSATIPDQVHSMSQIALKKDHVFIDTVGEEDEETHAKVHNCSDLS